MARKTKRTVICSETIEELNINDCYVVEVLDSTVPYMTFVSKEWFDKNKPDNYKIAE